MYRLYRKMTIYGRFSIKIYTFLGPIFEPCIQNRPIMNRVIKRLMCISIYMYLNIRFYHVCKNQIHVNEFLLIFVTTLCFTQYDNVEM